MIRVSPEEISMQEPPIWWEPRWIVSFISDVWAQNGSCENHDAAAAIGFFGYIDLGWNPFLHGGDM